MTSTALQVYKQTLTNNIRQIVIRATLFFQECKQTLTKKIKNSLPEDFLLDSCLFLGDLKAKCHLAQSDASKLASM